MPKFSKNKLMRLIKYIAFILLIAFGISSCSPELSGKSKAQTKNLKSFNKPKRKGWRKHFIKNGTMLDPRVTKETKKIMKGR